MNRWKTSLTLFAALMMFALTTKVLAQSSLGGSVNGTVTDTSGAVVPNATVELRSTETGVVQATKTSSAGQFVFPVVQVGQYSLDVSAPEFANASLAGVTVSPNKTTTQPITLRVGSATEVIQVTANTVQLETESSQQGTSFDNSTYESLPLALAGAPRSPTALSDLMPGVATAPTNSSTFSEPGESQIFSQTVNGGQTLASEIYYDGVAMLQTNVAGDYRYQPVPVEAISEFTLVQNNFSAEYSRTPGGVISLNTRSGTDAWHGEAYEYNENNAMNAAGWYNPKPPVERQNEFGISAGGPIRKGKTFAFGYYSGFRFNSTKPLSPTLIPSAAEVQGDFSGLTNNNGQVKIYDPTTTTYDPNTQTYSRQQFSCNGVLNVICPDRFSNAAKQFIPYIPKNYLNGNENGQPNFLGGGFTSDNYDRWGVKIDQYFGTKDILHAFYGQSPYTVQYPTEVYKNPFTGIGFLEPDNALIIRISENHTFSPSLMNYAAAGYNRDNGTYTSPRTFSAITLGISNIPNVTPALGFGQYGPAGWGDPGQRIIENGIAASDFISWLKGRHTLKIGAEIRHYQDNTIPISSSQFNFSTAETNDPNNPSNTGNEFASFLIGAVDSANQQYALSEITSHFWYWGAYLQDTYKVNGRLTLNLGLRYDVPWTRVIKNNIYSSFDPTAPNPGAGGILGALVFAGDGPGHCNCTRFSNTRFNLFQPRAGFVVQVDKSTVIRGGTGIFEGSAGDVLENGSRVFSDGFNANPSVQTQDAGLTPAFSIDSGFPAFQKPPILDPSLDNNASINYIQPQDGTPPRIAFWNVDVQRALPGNILLDVGYVGNRATHISSNLENLNQGNPKNLALGNVLAQPLTPTISAQYNIPYPWPGFSGPVWQALRPYPQYLYIGQPMQTSGWSHYDALQVKAQRSYSNGISLLVSYTYAQLLTTGESQHQYLDANIGAQNSFDLSKELTPSASEPPQIINLAYIYSLPFGRGKKFGPHSGAGDALLGGWRISMIQRYQSGVPFAVDVPLLTQNVLYQNEERPNLVPGVPIKNHWRGRFNPYTDTYLNPLAFSQPAPYTFGNAPRTLHVRGFAWNNEDFGLGKDIPFEGHHFSIESHAFNVFNRVAIGGLDAWGPGTNADFGHMNGQSNTPRVLQVSGTLKF
jgi:hypothetical protein